jgi:hypothetical protein
MLEFVDFVPGGAGPQFGRLTGGVVEAYSRASEGDSDGRWHGVTSLTLFEGNFLVRGPVGGGTLSVSDRTSIWDLVARSQGRDWGANVPLWGYNDFQVVYRLPIGQNQELSAVVLGAWDDIAFSDRPTQVHTEFYRAGVTWRARLGDRALRVSTSYGNDRFTLRIREPGQGLQLDTSRKMHDLRVAADIAVPVGGWIPVIRAGTEVHGIRPEVGMAMDWQIQEWFVVDRTYWDYGLWAGAWTEAELRPTDKVVVLPGLRLDYDTLVAQAWVDPRLTVRWFARPDLTASVSGGLYHRPHPFALAFVEETHLGLTQGTQLSGGAQWQAHPSLGLDGRLFWNTFQDQVQGEEWFPALEGDVLGDGRAYGAELYTRFASPDGRAQGSIGYALSRTEWINATTEGQWTLSDSDQTHGLVMTVQYLFGNNWALGSRVRWFSGFPYTTYQADVYLADAGGYVGAGAQPWAGRAPRFFQVDARATKRWEGRLLTIEAFFDLQNATFRPNVDRIEEESGRPTDPGTADALPFFPSLGITGRF